MNIANNDPIQPQALETVAIRNDFYKDRYRLCFVMLSLCIFAMLGLSLSLVYILTNPPKPVYFAVTQAGRLVPMIPLNVPNMSTPALLEWSNMVATSVYTYNFIDYRKAFQDNSDYFTPDGWSTFMSALKDSNNLDAVISKKLIVTAVATGAPVIIAQGMYGDAYAWKIQIPVLVNYQSASEFTQQNLLITMLVIRVSTLKTAKGIAVKQFIAAPSG